MDTNESIERLRQWLARIVDEKGSFTHPDVLRASHMVDRVVVRIQREQLQEVQEKADIGIYA